ncbi:hypothetical protein CSV69_09500 [Sporosarcina sp. P26b]|uniref:hypothetical protein n=1 Tax=Sporosarcina sp. P26b TaxID=2048253 RepID=UPI000C16E2DB|nr:hypothetical protein [Sporosarcina sp. P26b]PIC95751.1 hypothetical protein CSV69_09500 [Sporosarcina sp. P26b]
MKVKRKNLERLLNKLLFLRKDVLEYYLASELLHLELEKSYKGMYIDLYAIHAEENLPVFIEVQKDELDAVHSNQLKELIRHMDEGIILWIGTKASSHFTDELIELARVAEKSLQIQFLELDSYTIEQLDLLRQEDPVTAVRKIMSPEFHVPQFLLKAAARNMRERKGTPFAVRELSKTEKVNKSLMDLLRHTYPYFDNVLRSKSNLDRRQIQMGSGTGYIEIVLTAVSTPTKEAMLELRSTNHTTINTLQQIQNKLHKIEFSSPTTYETKRFVIHYGTTLSTEEIFEKLLPDFGRLIHVLIDFHRT